MKQPIVSVITPVFNGKEYIAGCIESILRQTYPHIEHIIIDGESADGTIEVIKDYQNRFPERIRFLSGPDKGPGDAWNKGLKMATGDIFGCLGADDEYNFDAIETVVSFFNSHKDAFFVHGDCDFINRNGEIIYHHRVGEFNLKSFLNTAKHISTTSAFYKRIVMEKIGWCDLSGDDFDVMVRIAKNFKIYHTSKTFSRLRWQSGTAFNPDEFTKRRQIRKDRYEVSRYYGGSLFSRIALSYYCYEVIGIMQLKSIFPFMIVLYRRLFSNIKP